MKRKLLAAAMSLLLLLGLFPTAYAVEPQSATLTITASQTTAKAGDEITFNVSLSKCSSLMSIAIYVQIPEGLTYKSGELTDDLTNAGNKFFMSDWTYQANKNRGLISLIPKVDSLANLDKTMNVATFTCTVDEDYSGTAVVGFDQSATDIRHGTTIADSDKLSLTYSDASVSVTIPATGITTTPTSVTLEKGETQALTTALVPANATNQGVTYITSNKGVATVSDAGVITAVGEGTATITATSADGGYTATCTVTVPHQHTYGSTWKSDATQHWKECTAKDGAKSETAKHSGGTATCKALAICDTCGATYGDYAAHTLTAIARVEPTHFATGNIAYYECTTCGKYFADADATTEITKDSTVLAVVPHNYGTEWNTNETQHWKECGCGNKVETADHTFAWVIDTPATEESTGVKHEACTVCGLTRNEGTVIDKLTHEMTHHDAVAATCVAEGNVEYYSCANCGKNYANEAGTKVLETVVTAIDATNHTGNTEVKDAKEATCTEDGYTGDTYCTDCSAKIETGSVIDALGHDLQKVEAVEATHAAAGNTEYYACARCDALFADAEGETATTADEVVIPQIPHDIDAEKWESDAENHWNACTGCDAHVNAAAHTFGDWTITKAATATEEGEQTHTCTVCGYVASEKIAATGASQNTATGTNNGNGSGTNQSNSNGNSQTGVKTADNSMVELFGAVIAIAFAGMVALVIVSKKRARR